MNTDSPVVDPRALTLGFALSFASFRDLTAPPEDDRYGMNVRVSYEDGRTEYLHYSQYDVNPKTGAFKVNCPERYKDVIIDFECYAGGQYVSGNRS